MLKIAILQTFWCFRIEKRFYKEDDLRERLPTQSEFYEDYEDDDEILDTLGAKKDLWLGLEHLWY